MGGKPDEPGTLVGARTGSQTTPDGGFLKSSSHLNHPSHLERSTGRAADDRCAWPLSATLRAAARKGEGPEFSRIVRTRGLQKKSGSDLLSRAVSRGVPSALEGLTSVFGMGTGGTPPTLPPENSGLVHTKGSFQFPADRSWCLLPGPAPFSFRSALRGLDLGLESLTPTLRWSL